MNLTIEQARRHWSCNQGLDRRREVTAAEWLQRTGWVRTLGGVEAYLGAAARTELSVADVNAALTAGEIRVQPSVRGCIYLVPATDAALCLRVAELLSARRTARDLDKAGVKDGELEAVGEAVLAALAEHGALTTRKLGTRLPDGVVRKLGDKGKKVGLSSTLPPALRALEFAGRVRRVAQGDRLDHERYLWQPAHGPSPAEVWADDGAVYRALAERYFAWAGPATRKGFAAWAGCGQRVAKAAIAAAEADGVLVAVEVEDLGEAWLSAAALSAERQEAPEAVCWLPALDGLFALQEEATWLIDPAYREVPVAQFGRGPTRPFASVNQPLQRTLIWDGRAVGLWAWDPEPGAIVAKAFDNLPAPARAALAEGHQRAAAVIDAVGHAKAFSLDKDKTLAKRAALVRAAPGTLI